MKNSTKVPIQVCLLLFAVLGVLLFFWLFRTKKVDNPALGVIWYHARWGQLSSVKADTNRDGRIDFKGTFKPGEVVDEYWEDRDRDGLFEIHVKMLNDKVDFMEIDDDKDGRFDRRLSADQASAFYDGIAAQARPIQRNLN